MFTVHKQHKSNIFKCVPGAFRNIWNISSSLCRVLTHQLTHRVALFSYGAVTRAKRGPNSFDATKRFVSGFCCVLFRSSIQLTQKNNPKNH